MEMDWEQVRLHGEPPCFHEEKGARRYCGRAEHWAGHRPGHDHPFVSLEVAMDRVYVEGVKATTMIRCTKHFKVEQDNAEAPNGAECAICAVERSGL